jgi:hypothetical protein
VWIYIPDLDDKKEPWIGTVVPPARPGESWTFELIRHVEIADMYDASTLDERPGVVGLLNHQQQCTLLRPLVLHKDPGSAGIRLNGYRTRITGEFEGLLTGLSVEDVTAPIFAGFSFDSPSFGVWFAPPAFSSRFDSETRTYSVAIKPTESENLTLGTFGNLTCTTGAEVRERGRSGTLHSASLLRLIYDDPASLDDVIQLSTDLERLFGFLIGFRGGFPTIKTWLTTTYRVGKTDLPLDGTLELAGLDWKDGDLPHRLECIHRVGMGGGDLPTVLECFLANRESVMARVHAIETCRHFTNNLNSQFSVIMPAFEAYLKARYTETDETEYLEQRDAFFAWVDQAPDAAIGEFSKKHLKEVNTKAPSLQILISRAIDAMNAKGFVFPAGLARRITKRRGSLFHSVASFEVGEARTFYEEVRAAVGLLMLHTYEDLGIDVSYLSTEYGVKELRSFTVHGQTAEAAS